MNAGFGQRLEGFLIKGNLSVVSSNNPTEQGDGSLEGSGTLYFDAIKEYNVDNGVNIQNVSFKNGIVNIPYIIPSESLTSASIILNGGMSIGSTENSLSITSGGGLTIAGGLSVGKSMNIGGIVNMNDNKIVNVPLPTEGKDAVNKDYIDLLFENYNLTTGTTYVSGNFTSGQIIIADSNNNSIRGYENFLYDGITLNLFSTDVNSFVCYGGVSINKDVFIGGILNVNNNNIINVGTPILGSDAVNKDYVDNLVSNATAGNINGNFTSGQLIIADSNGNSIRGYDNIIYNNLDNTYGSLILNENTNLVINNTAQNSLSVIGGVNIEGILDVNLKNIINVADPILNYDAVNKQYVDNLIGNNNNYFQEIEFVLNNNVLVPEIIPDFTYSSYSIKAFVASIYVKTPNSCALYTLRGMNVNNNWLLSTSLIGAPLGVNFYISLIDGYASIQYTNQNTYGITSIKYLTTSLIYTNSEITYTLLPNTVSYTDIPILTYPNENLHSLKIFIYISSDTDNKYGFTMLNALLKNNTWSISTNNIGNITGINFNITSDTINSTVQYTNTNASNDYTIRITSMNITDNSDNIILNPNITSPEIITEISIPIDEYYFEMSIYVNIPDLNLSALYEIQGVVCDNTWDINTRYIGDYTGIKFFINTIDDIGYISYTNINNFDAIIYYVKNIPLTSIRPLQVSEGGTGNSFLNPYTILRGNGYDPIIGTDDLIYKDSKLIVGNNSSIILQNTQSSTNLSSGALVIYGGASINKELIIGTSLSVNNVNVTPNLDDIVKEQIFYGSHDITIPENIDGFIFNESNTKTFSAMVSINIVLDDENEYDSLYEIKGLRKKSGWILNYTFIGDHTHISFFINNSGQIQYTLPFVNNWISTTFKFRALTLS